MSSGDLLYPAYLAASQPALGRATSCLPHGIMTCAKAKHATKPWPALSPRREAASRRCRVCLALTLPRADVEPFPPLASPAPTLMPSPKAGRSPPTRLENLRCSQPPSRLSKGLPLVHSIPPRNPARNLLLWRWAGTFCIGGTPNRFPVWLLLRPRGFPQLPCPLPCSPPHPGTRLGTRWAPQRASWEGPHPVHVCPRGPFFLLSLENFHKLYCNKDDKHSG